MKTELRPIKEWLCDFYSSAKDARGVESLFGTLWDIKVESRKDAAKLVQLRANSYMMWIVGLVSELHLDFECIDPITRQLPQSEIDLSWVEKRQAKEQADYVKYLKEAGFDVN
jgi:hypothetical protein